jgi:acetyl esterase/lipase
VASVNSRNVLTRSAPPPDTTIRYGQLPDHVADVWLPATDAGTPLVIFVHGGFWRAEFDRTHAGPLAVALAAAGYPVAALEYRRLGGGGGWPATFDDVAAGIAALPELIDAELRARSSTPIGDRGVVLMGHSAGGQLVLWAGRTGDRIRGIVALAPVADLARGYAMSLGNGAVGSLLGGGPGDVPDRYAAVDPAANLPLGVPTVVVHGRADLQVPYEIGRDWAAASAASGDRTSLLDLAGIDHFGLIDPLSSAWITVTSGLASVCGAGRG